MGCSASKETISDYSAPPEGQVKEVQQPTSFKAVHSAVRWNKYEDLKKLLRDPEAVNIPDEGNGNLPIHIAAQNGHYEILKLLVEKKALVNATNGKGNTPLHMAVGYDYYNCAKYLMSNGASAESINDAGSVAIKGLDGDKSLCMAALISAEKGIDLKLGEEALNMCEADINSLEKAAFASAGLKLKKALGDQWTESMQTQFKSIMLKL